MVKKRDFLILLGVILLFFSVCSNQNPSRADSVSKATGVYSVSEIPDIEQINMETDAIIFLYSYHHGNTRKIANAIAPVINASIIDIENNIFGLLERYKLIGFGSGIDSERHFQPLLDFAERLPNVQDKKAFIFSTSGIYSEDKMLKDHEALRNILQSKGFIIIGEFGCLGHNTNSFLRIFGGMNKGRPNPEDVRNAGFFAENLKSEKEFL
ncbi:MAG: flavodoxin family protein [Treponema sp.]|jgi:flavodoxin|nr:flavodoxin family protein [Treponema sp.]